MKEPAESLRPGNLVICDDPATHRVTGIREILQRKGADIRFLALASGDPFSDFSPPLFQVTPLRRFGTPGNENPFTDGEERTVISDHRDRIVELQDEVTEHDEDMASMLDVQNTNSSDIRANTAGIAELSGRVGTFADDFRKNTAGISLAYAVPSSGLNCNESFRLSGGTGYFEEKAAVAFGFTGRLCRKALPHPVAWNRRTVCPALALS